MKSKVAALSSPGKALPAADGSMTTLGGRLEALNIAFAGGNRDAYRGPLFTIPALGEHISGAILLDETIRRKIAARPPAPPLRPRNDQVHGLLPLHRELLAPLQRPSARRTPAHPARLLP